MGAGRAGAAVAQAALSYDRTQATVQAYIAQLSESAQFEFLPIMATRRCLARRWPSAQGSPARVRPRRALCAARCAGIAPHVPARAQVLVEQLQAGYVAGLKRTGLAALQAGTQEALIRLVRGARQQFNANGSAHYSCQYHWPPDLLFRLRCESCRCASPCRGTQPGQSHTPERLCRLVEHLHRLVHRERVLLSCTQAKTLLNVIYQNQPLPKVTTTVSRPPARPPRPLRRPLTQVRPAGQAGCLPHLSGL